MLIEGIKLPDDATATAYADAVQSLYAIVAALDGAGGAGGAGGEQTEAAA